jgi:hypothetical protein
MKLRAWLISGLIATAACEKEAPAPPPAGELEPAGLLYQGALWTKPQGALFGAGSCKIRRSLPGCEEFIEPALRAVAVDGHRLVAVMDGDGFANRAPVDLVLSEDLGATARRLPLAGQAGSGEDVQLYLGGGRVFLFAPADDPRAPGHVGARVFEIDPVRGTVTARGGDQVMSSAAPTASADGTLTSVAFGRDRPPQVLTVTRLDPATGAISRDDLACTVEGCDPSAFYRPFLSDDGNIFDRLVSPEGAVARTCVLSVDARARAVRSACSAAFASDDLTPVSSFGGRPYDFQLSLTAGGAPSWLVPVTRHWIPAGQPLTFGAYQLDHAGGSFFRFSPSGFATYGDSVLLRLGAGGHWQQTEVAHTGCLNLGPFVGPATCPRAISFQALSANELLLVTQRDEFDEEGRSRQLFEVVRSAAPFTDSRP